MILGWILAWGDIKLQPNMIGDPLVGKIHISLENGR